MYEQLKELQNYINQVNVENLEVDKNLCILRIKITGQYLGVTIYLPRKISTLLRFNTDTPSQITYNCVGDEIAVLVARTGNSTIRSGINYASYLNLGTKTIDVELCQNIHLIALATGENSFTEELNNFPKSVNTVQDSITNFIPLDELNNVVMYLLSKTQLDECRPVISYYVRNAFNTPELHKSINYYYQYSMDRFSDIVDTVFRKMYTNIVTPNKKDVEEYYGKCGIYIVSPCVLINEYFRLFSEPYINMDAFTIDDLKFVEWLVAQQLEYEDDTPIDDLWVAMSNLKILDNLRYQHLFDTLLRVDIRLLFGLNVTTQTILDILSQGTCDNYISNTLWTEINYNSIEDYFIDNYMNLERNA